MKTLARRLWEEPALFLTVLAAAVDVVLQLVGAPAALLAVPPLLAGAATRQLVTPTTRPEPADPLTLRPEIAP